VVLDLDGEREYTVTRGTGELRVTVGGNTSGSFAAWRSSPEIVATGAAAGELPSRSRDVNSNRSAPSGFTKDTRPAFSSAAAQPRITVTYLEADVRDVIAGFAAFSGRTIVVGKGVSGNVSAEIHDQPWDVALRAILSSQGLAAREDADGIISVDSYANIAAQQSAEPLTTQVISVNYARAASLVPTIKSLLVKECPVGAPGIQVGGECKSRGDVAADSGTNRLIITEVPSRIKDIVNYVQDLDVRTPQVAIKAKIILVNRKNLEDIGLAYDLGMNNTFFNKLIQRQDPSKPPGTPYEPERTIVELGGNSLAAVGNANQRVASPALQLLYSATIGKFSLTSFLEALQEVSYADVQAEPSIVTLDNRKAEILSGEETPIRVVDVGQGGGTVARSTVQLKETGIILSVTPHITNNRKILMTLHAERSQLQQAASDLGFTFLKQRANNELLVGDGETAVIGGLTVTQISKVRAGIPFLSGIPVVGRLFSQTRSEEIKNDLLILVTPHIVDEGELLGPPGN
jgi:type IV pilus assembly protein PilQ